MRSRNKKGTGLRRIVNGKIVHEYAKVMDRAPIKVGCYSPAERFLIVELALLFYVKKDTKLTPHTVSTSLKNQLVYARCEQLLNVGVLSHNVYIHISLMAKSLISAGYIETTQAKPGRRGHFSPDSPWDELRVTKKGWRHVKKQSQRLRLAAEKVIYTSVLDRLGRATVSC